MRPSRNIGFIGSGNMAESLIRGILSSGLFPKDAIRCFDTRGERLAHLARTWGVTSAKSNVEIAKQCDIIFLATKPHQIVGVLEEIKGSLAPDKLVISIAAGVGLPILESTLQNIPIVRAMPNTPALVLEGMTTLSFGRGVTDEHRKMARALFDGVGRTIELEEKHMDAVTALSGAGPAYIFLVIEAMAEGGVKAGLPYPVALELAAQTAIGAGRLVLETKRHPGELKEIVASPGGTTVEALAVLEKTGVKRAFTEAVAAAFRRSQELIKK